MRVDHGLSRRAFLARGASSAALVASGVTLPGFLGRSARAAAQASESQSLLPSDSSILVIVQLSGGNDGLNTVIPFADDRYHRARPTLRAAAANSHRLGDTLALHPDMAALKRLHDSGRLATVTSVGYPNPDRSHFRAMDIWQTASLMPEDARDGWLGRAADRITSANREAEAPAALHLDNAALPLALHSQTTATPSVRSLDSLRLSTGARTAQEAMIAESQIAANQDLMYVQRVAVSACANARRIEQVSSRSTETGAYPNFGLAQRLRQIARLIEADFGARIYYTSLEGFDTHSGQSLVHGPLLRELSESLAAFDEDMRHKGLGDRVLCMTFSEFGRRLHENGSQGTDHGAAAPMFLLGAAVRPGVIGGDINLGVLEQGDMTHRIDFRSVYAAVLDGWLHVSSTEVLGSRHEQAPVLNAPFGHE